MKHVIIIVAFSLFLSSSAVATSQEGAFSFLVSDSNEVNSRSSDEPEVQEQISSAMIDIMSTSIGLAICSGVLNSDAKAIEHHLGVESATSEIIARNCKSSKLNSPWVSPTPAGQIEKMSINGSQKRTYVFIRNGDSIPFDSWTEPFSNSTVFVIHSKRDKPINRQRLIQLLAHETAVYFDSKAQIGHFDASSLRQLKHLKYFNTNAASANTAMMNPIIGHTLTFIRALRVEQAIVADLVNAGKMDWPEEYKDSLIADLLSESCRHFCLEKVVQDMSEIYLPLSLPLVALSPTYRTQKRRELAPLMSKDPTRWTQLTMSLDTYPQQYINSIDVLKARPFMELIGFFASPTVNPNYFVVENAFRFDLWKQDWLTVRATTVQGPEGNRHPIPFVEFMREPLLSGFNIRFSNGPRVRIRAGDTL